MASTESVKVDPKDPNVRRMVYNMYRGILGNYNDKANDIISAVPKDRVVEDQGITRQLESMIRQQSQISGGGNSPISNPGPQSPTTYHDSVAPPPPPPPPMSQGGIPPPPPPPPPIGLVHIPNMRLKTEIPDVRREPPAAIQNAMMTKDKKPFTYTPGGLDLSQIRSPRMQRRINRNAQAEDAIAANGVDHQPPQRPVSMPPGSGVQPQLAVPVFPQAIGNGQVPQPPPPPPPMQHWSPQAPPPQPLAVPKQVQPQRQVPSPAQNTGSIYVPPVQTQPQPQQQSPRSQLGSLYVAPVAANRPLPQQEPAPAQYSPTPQLNKSPAPWMSRNSQAQQQAKDVPPWVSRQNVQSPPSPSPSPVQMQNSNSSPYGGQQQSYPQSQTQTRVIPIQIEGREASQSNTRIIPIQLEGTPSPQQNAPQFNYQQQPQNNYQQQQPQNNYQQQQPQNNYQQQQRRPIYVHNKNSPQPFNENSTVDGRSPQGWVNQSDDMASSTPVQSRSFRVLQKMTDANNSGEAEMPYNSQGVPLSQLRKLQLSDDDRALMDKVKTQVSDSIIAPIDEENPRYRGGYIPSRVFRALDESVPHGPSATHVLTNKRPQQQEPTPPPLSQPYIPPSEQQVQEPRKYQGGSIPSRSFRMLQAMTAGPNPSGRPDESEY